MLSTPPADIAEALEAARARLMDTALGVQWHETVTSTMDVAEALANAGAAEGLVVAAGAQTEGRGRRGRVWHSPPGAGLYLTFLLRPSLDVLRIDHLGLLTLASGLAVREAMQRATGFSAELKWPNDVMVGRRKLAGILAEGLGLGTGDQVVLLGMGVNLLSAQRPLEIALRATSLEEETGRVPDRGRLVEELLVAVMEEYRRLCRGEADTMLRAWCRAAPSIEGHPVQWQADRQTRRGTTAGIAGDGALLVRTPTGVERVVAGEVIWL